MGGVDGGRFWGCEHDMRSGGGFWGFLDLEEAVILYVRQFFCLVVSHVVWGVWCGRDGQ